MSEYQYYEFRAVDRMLDAAEIKELRKLSSRASITATSFTNHYEWGDFRGGPDRLMERYFDLFLYFANWGTRQLSLRLPIRLVEAAELRRFIAGDVARLRETGGSVILDIRREAEDEHDIIGDEDVDGDDDGKGWLDALAALRTDLIAGDLRVLYLVWLMAVESGDVPDGTAEPLPGIAPLTPTLNDFAAFFGIDHDLVAAAAEAGAPPAQSQEPPLADRVAALPEREKIDLLVRLHDGEPHVAALLRRRLRPSPAAGPAPKRRTAGELRAEAAARAEARRLAEARKAEAERRRREKAAAEVRLRRLSELAQRGEAVWKDLERFIGDRNKIGYEKATALLLDLRDLALAKDTDDQFAQRLRELAERHARKPQLRQRLAAAGLM